MSYMDRKAARAHGVEGKVRLFHNQTPIRTRGRRNWYGAQLAEAIERRRNDEPMPVRTPRPAPPVLRDAPILPRPAGMSRQVWRSLYRQAKKAARMVGPGPEVTTP